MAEYGRRVAGHWVVLLIGVVLFSVGTAQVVLTNLAFPWWAWAFGGILCLLGAQFLAFHDVRAERDKLFAEARKENESRIAPTFSYDSQNFLVINLANHGPTIKEARINLIVPDRGPEKEQRLARMGNFAPYDKGGVKVVDEELVAGLRSLVYRESHLEIEGYTVTELRFLTSHSRSDPIRFQLGADELQGWITWPAVIVSVPTEPFDKDAFTP